MGGGSGGHITPVLAVAKEIKKQQPDTRLVYVIGKGDKLVDIPAHDEHIDDVVQVRAGKFRRYHGEGIRQLLDVQTMLKNMRDFFYVLVGTVQSYRLLGRYRPQAIFIKGGFVGVPVGLAAAVRRIPYVTHDSDAVPGLANRIIARWAAYHAVAQPKQLYPYPKDKVVEVGVPVSSLYHPVSTKERQLWRKELGIPSDGQVILLTGGGNGSKLLNKALVSVAPELLAELPKIHVLHIAGRGNESDVMSSYASALGTNVSRVTVKGFVNDLHKYSGSADLVITRAGANSLADFAVQKRTCIVVPNPYLTGGHQIKNAEVLLEKNAIELVQEESIKNDDRALLWAIRDLLRSPADQLALAENLHRLYKTDSAQLIVDLLLKQTKQ